MNSLEIPSTFDIRNSRFLFGLLALSDRTADDRLRLFNDLGQVFGAFKAFRIKLVDLFGAGGLSSKPEKICPKS